MAEKKEKKLKDTKGNFKLKGVITRLDEGKNAYTEKPNKSGGTWRKLQFSVKTLDNDEGRNEIKVELQGNSGGEVWTWNAKEREVVRFPFEQRKNLPESHHIMGSVRVGFGQNPDGKLKQQSLHTFDAAEFIYENFEDGMSVYVNGHIEYSSYTKDDGEKVTQTKYIVDSIGQLREPIDFKAEDFKEESVFEQEIVIVDVEIDKEAKKAYVHNRLIDRRENFEDGVMVINGKNDNANALIRGFKKLKFGTLIKVFGHLRNMAVISEVTPEPVKIDKNNPFADFDDTQDDIASRFKRNAVTNYVNEIEITNIDKESIEPKKYKEEDFEKAVEEEVVDSSNPFADADDDSDPWA